MAKILVIDDEENIRGSLKSALERREHSVVTAADIKEARTMLNVSYDLVFLDIMLPDGNGLELLKEILTLNSEQMVVMISGHADINMAIEAIKSGAYDFIEKPLSLDKILITIDNAVKTDQLHTEVEKLSSQIYGEMIGQSASILKLKEDIKKSAPRTSRFLILGENGTGKELVANMIHRFSNNAKGPFVAVNCAALPSELVESELFGHTAGAFTGANKARRGKFSEANGGSIFLDEISEMPLEAQAKILRTVETKMISPVGSDKTDKVNLNIIAATNRNLNQMVAESRFRQDLLYRLNVVTFELPPLRERKDDIPLLCEFFLKQFAFETKTKVKKISTEANSYLMAFHFPGNIRELRNLMERLNIYCEADIIQRADLEELLPFVPKNEAQNLKEAVAAFEQKQIESSIKRNGGNVAKAARELGLERSLLYKKMKKWNN